MKTKFPRFFGSRRLIGGTLALVSLLAMGALGSWPAGTGLAVLFLAAGFLTLPDRQGLSAAVRLLWAALCIFLSCCYPSWMLEYNFFEISANRIFLNIVCQITYTLKLGYALDIIIESVGLRTYSYM